MGNNQIIMEWTDDVVARLTDLWAAGLSVRKIAKTLGISRDQVSGKIRRLRRKDPSIESRNAPLRIAEALTRGGGKVNYERREQIRTIMDGLPKCCAWIDGDPLEKLRTGHLLFCGLPVKHGSSYCSEHHAICWKPREEKIKA